MLKLRKTFLFLLIFTMIASFFAYRIVIASYETFLSPYSEK
jgi:hypothetical protein